jgi:hypothetical protein
VLQQKTEHLVEVVVSGQDAVAGESVIDVCHAPSIPSLAVAVGPGPGFRGGAAALRAWGGTRADARGPRHRDAATCPAMTHCAF